MKTQAEASQVGKKRRFDEIKNAEIQKRSVKIVRAADGLAHLQYSKDQQNKRFASESRRGQ